MAPSSALELMWHQDNNWTNALWWLRGVRNVLIKQCTSIFPSRLSRQLHTESVPGTLWWCLSGATFVLFIAIPLSGLTMELVHPLTYGTSKARIFGPTPAYFNLQAQQDLSKQIRGNWRSGRPTTPGHNAILYAPEGTSNVSLSHYVDLINLQPDNGTIRFFAGPAVNEAVYGNAWGLQTNVTCHKAHQDGMTLIKTRGYNDYLLNATWTLPSLGWELVHPDDLPLGTYGGVSFFNETGTKNYIVGYSLIAAAEGTSSENSPYTSRGDEGPWGVSTPSTPKDQPPVVRFEAYLWQAYVNSFPDPRYEEWLRQPLSFMSKSYVVLNDSFGESGQDIPERVTAIGFGVTCQISSAVGNATVRPESRTPEFDYLHPQQGIQIAAVRALGNWDIPNESMIPSDPAGSSSTWLAAQLAVNNLPYISPLNAKVTTPVYHALTADNLQLAMYKLIGETAIAMMSPGAQGSWYGNLYSLTPCYYLSTGVVPWQVVFVLLAIWTVLTVFASIWMAFQKRWAPTLSGFEFFKFGAHFHHEVNQMESQRFEHCEATLGHIPGMVGSLSRVEPKDDDGLGFVGLSKQRARQDGRFVLDQMWAGWKPSHTPSLPTSLESNMVSLTLLVVLEDLKIAFLTTNGSAFKKSDRSWSIGSTIGSSPMLSQREPRSRDVSRDLRKSSKPMSIPQATYYWEVVGECYVHGMMDGEAIAWQNANGVKL
ncbi:MAG: hypothetical protein Q9160_005379 [Pyrenula sp. 1 TL-2023]